MIKGGDLIFFEGPVLSHFFDENGNDYLMRWTEMDDTANRWLLFQATKEQISKHLSGKVSLLWLVKKTESGAVYFLDMDNDIEYRHIKHVEAGKIPEQYLPEKDAYFDMKYGTPYARQLEAELRDYLKKQKHEHSFWETATVNLFGKHSIENKLAGRFSPFGCTHFDPIHFPDQYVLSLIDFPLLLHRHANKANYIEEFFGTALSSLSSDWIGQPFYEPTAMYWATIANKISIDHLSPGEISALIKKILESTQNIVAEHPDEYSSLYNEWKKLVARNVAEINTIDKVLADNLALDLH